MHTALDVVQIVKNLIEVAVLNKIVLQTFQSIDLCRALGRNWRGSVQYNLSGHFPFVLFRPVRNEAPCLKLVVDKSTLSTVRANTCESLYFRAAFIANHVNSSLLLKFYYI